MKRTNSARSFALCIIVITSLGSVQAQASSIDCSGTKKSKSAPYLEKILPGDQPDHEMRQAIRTHVISSRSEDFDGGEQTAYAHEDRFGGAGTSVGYFLYTLKSGEKVWAKFDSIFSTATHSAGWEVTYQGVFHFTAGTGKFAGIRGGGHYEGKITQDKGFEEQFVCSAQY